jgi:hypothetical protein
MEYHPERRGLLERKAPFEWLPEGRLSHAMSTAELRDETRVLRPRKASGVADKRSLGAIGLVLAGVTFAVVLVAAAVVQAQTDGAPDPERASEQVMAGQAPASSR